MISSLSTSNYLSRYYLDQLKSSSGTSSAANSQTTKSEDDTADQLVLSNAVQQLMNMLNKASASNEKNEVSGSEEGKNETRRAQGPPPDGPPPGGKPGEDITQAVEEKQAEFNAGLMAKLDAAGVDTTQDIALAYDDEGKIVVTSNVSAEDKETIESILAEDAELTASYKELADLTAFAAEMEERFAQGPPPPPPSGMDGTQGMFSSTTGTNFGTTASSVASAYAANSTLPSNSSSSATALLQQLLQSQSLGS